MTLSATRRRSFPTDGDIVRKVRLCGLSRNGKPRRAWSDCPEVDALIDTGATCTIISRTLAERAGAEILHGATILHGRPHDAAWMAIRLSAPGCGRSKHLVAIDDRRAASAGPRAFMILGHDYLQDQQVQINYTANESQVSCPPRSARRPAAPKPRKPGQKHHARMKAPKKSAEELFVRFGTWHPSERSRNYALGGNEDGVSVYDVVWNERAKRWNVKMPPESDNPWGPEDTFWTLIKEAETGADPIFIVRGDVAGVGHDGEPLIRHVKVEHKITARDVMSTDLRWQGLKDSGG